MMKWVKRFGVIALAISLLAACQSLDIARIKNIKETESSKNNALVFCKGTEICEFERLDYINIVDENRKRVTKDAIDQGIVRLADYSFKSSPALYLSVLPKRHEVVIRFYPVSKEKAEKLIVIHDFKKNQRYVFEMYRQREAFGGSLLKVSAPEPLCVDLKANQKTIRRFCKPHNAQNGLGEFVEKKLTVRRQ
ncbi:MULTISPECIES: hypothetical protein [unclassified Acinetobacter]|uniref:hypothetical protein n=1 Tax=unclassified Acinetobacter TaxID=196816 RepID=UPI002934BEFC|nr:MULTISPECIES: hypothetical protein [unclassified Acinetobacter]WOE31203.1 hypothetical protein QSG84_12825 [Acinetobacter sp. SAAs470]WOE39399.1 hypothetical protein QSG86_06490 [Acinetobacter sp. SAAs474]